MSFVDSAEFDTRYENTIPLADWGRVDAFLEDACALAIDITGVDYPVVDATATPPPVVYLPIPGAIVATICTAVRRAYENPSGLGGETIGDYSWRVSAANSGVYFTNEEARVIRRAAGKSGVGSLTMTTDSPMPAIDPLIGTGWGTDDEDDFE